MADDIPDSEKIKSKQSIGHIVEKLLQEAYDRTPLEELLMPSLALNITMQGKPVVVVGGGAVALRKVQALLCAETTVRVVAETLCAELAELVTSGAVAGRLGMYCASDLEGAFLAIAATDDRLVNEAVCADARAAGVLVNVVDDPAAGDVTFPALLRRGELAVAVSTGGGSPSFAVAVRDKIAGLIGDEYGVILDQLALEREKLLTNGSPSTYNVQVLRSLAERLLAELTERKELAP